jgi:hypothetical protein
MDRNRDTNGTGTQMDRAGTQTDTDTDIGNFNGQQLTQKIIALKALSFNKFDKIEF